MRSAVNLKYHQRIDGYGQRAFRLETRLRHRRAFAAMRTSPPSFMHRLFSKYRNDFLAGRRPDRSFIEDLMEQTPQCGDPMWIAEYPGRDRK
jgi:hypothetical protein